MSVAIPATTDDTPRETVVLLHGVALNRWFMAPLQRALEREGYRVLNLTYPSRRFSVAELGDTWLPARLEQASADRATRLHLVGHSMGGLVIRRLLAGARPANLGRVVTIGTPHTGAVLADRLGSVAPVRWLIGRNLAALGTGPDAAWRALPTPVDHPLGTIAGTRAVNPLFGRWLGPVHDGTVAEPSTHVAGEADAIALPFSHTGLIARSETARQVIAFLRHGRFAR